MPAPQRLPATGLGADGGMGGRAMPHSSLHSADQPMPVIEKKRGSGKTTQVLQYTLDQYGKKSNSMWYTECLPEFFQLSS